MNEALRIPCTYINKNNNNNNFEYVDTNQSPTAKQPEPSLTIRGR